MSDHMPSLDSGTPTPINIKVKTTVPGVSTLSSDIRVSLFTGGFDRPYAFGLIMALAAEGIAIEVVGADELDEPAVVQFRH